MANPNISELDWNQAIARCVNADEDNLRVQIESTDLSIELSADDGDSVLSVPQNSQNQAALTAATTGVATQVLVPVACQGLSKAQLYALSTTAVASPITFTLQVSPVDTGNVWVSTTLTLVCSSSLNTLVMATPATNIVARRVRVISSAALGALETVTLYMVLSA